MVNCSAKPARKKKLRCQAPELSIIHFTPKLIKANQVDAQLKLIEYAALTAQGHPSG